MSRFFAAASDSDSSSSSSDSENEGPAVKGNRAAGGPAYYVSPQVHWLTSKGVVSNVKFPPSNKLHAVCYIRVVVKFGIIFLTFCIWPSLIWPLNRSLFAHPRCLKIAFITSCLKSASKITLNFQIYISTLIKQTACTEVDGLMMSNAIAFYSPPKS